MLFLIFLFFSTVGISTKLVGRTLENEHIFSQFKIKGNYGHGSKKKLARRKWIETLNNRILFFF